MTTHTLIIIIIRTNNLQMGEAIDKINVFVNVIMLRWKCLKTCSVHLMGVSWEGSKFDIVSCVKIVGA